VAEVICMGPSPRSSTRLTSICLAALAAGLALMTFAAPAADSAQRRQGLRVVIVKHPKAHSPWRTAHFRWRVNRRIRGARCRLDRRRPRPCRRRVSYRRLGNGRHRFGVTVRRGHRVVRTSLSWRVAPPRAKGGKRKPPRPPAPAPAPTDPSAPAPTDPSAPAPTDPSAPAPTDPSGPAPTGATTVWSAGMDGDSLSEWYYPEAGPSGNFGGGEYNSGSGDTVVSADRAHSGSRSAKATIFSSGGTRLFRWREARQNRDLLYESWFFIPTAYRLTADPSNGRFWDIFQFKSRSSSGAVDPIWYLDLKNRADGSLSPTLIWWHRTLEGPESGQAGFRRFLPPDDVVFPVGRWVNVTARLRQSRDFDGVLQFWIDGRLVFNMQNVRTSYSNCAFNSWCGSNEWSVNNYSDGLDASPASLYIDDARISR
jgi:hypothetical protein